MLARCARIGLVLTLLTIALFACAREPTRDIDLSEVHPNEGSWSNNWTCIGCKTTRNYLEGTVQPSHYLFSDIMPIAVSAMTMPRETLDLYQDLLGYVGDKLGMRVELVQRRTYGETNDLIEDRLVDAAFVCSLPYVLGHAKFGMELLVAPEVDGRPMYYSYIITRADSGINGFEDLRGRTFAFVDPMSNSGSLYPNYRMAQMGESPASFFRNYFYTFSHDNSVKAVLDKSADAAAVESLIFDYMASKDPTVVSQMRIIEKSPPFGIPPVAVHPALNSEVKGRLRDIFLGMDRDERGRDILNRMNFDRFVLVNDSDYDSIREMYYLVQGMPSRR